MIQKFDILAGKKFFFPLIIWLCRRMNVNQYVFAAYTGVISMLFLIAVVIEDDVAMWWKIIVGVVVTLYVALAALRPEQLGYSQATRDRSFWRGFAWIFFAWAIADTLYGQDRATSIAMWFAILLSEYAVLIDTIPPEETREEAPKAIPETI